MFWLEMEKDTGNKIYCWFWKENQQLKCNEVCVPVWYCHPSLGSRMDCQCACLVRVNAVSHIHKEREEGGRWG